MTTPTRARDRRRPPVSTHQPVPAATAPRMSPTAGHGKATAAQKNQRTTRQRQGTRQQCMHQQAARRRRHAG